MLLTDYGYKLPQKPDRGKSFFPALEFNITRTADHRHDGTDSTLLPTNAVVVTRQAIHSAGWGSDLGGGTFSQEITLPFVGSDGAGGTAQLLWDAISVQIRDSNTGEIIYAKCVQSAAQKYMIYTNDNSADWIAVYSS